MEKPQVSCSKEEHLKETAAEFSLKHLIISLLLKGTDLVFHQIKTIFEFPFDRDVKDCLNFEFSDRNYGEIRF